MSKSTSTQWFVECKKNPDDNTRLREFLALHSVGDECELAGVLGTDGRPHDVIHLPNEFVSRLRDAKFAKRADPIFRFRFWKRTEGSKKISPADFIEQRYVPVSVQEAKANLEQIIQKKPK